jgi:hypothetical protein
MKNINICNALCNDTEDLKGLMCSGVCHNITNCCLECRFLGLSCCGNRGEYKNNDNYFKFLIMYKKDRDMGVEAK